MASGTVGRRLRVAPATAMRPQKLDRPVPLLPALGPGEFQNAPPRADAHPGTTEQALPRETKQAIPSQPGIEEEDGEKEEDQVGEEMILRV